MSRRPAQVTWSLTLAFLASVSLAGCPKKPVPATGASAAPSAPVAPSGGPGGGQAESGAAGTAPGTLGAGPGGAGGPGAPGSAASGGAAATGTTIPALPAPQEFVEVPALRDVHFDFDRSDIRPENAAILKDNAAWLKANVGALLLIEGHTDERGTNEYNLALGERRAKATRDYLVSLGIDAARITVISYGEERPVCTERTEACWARNRRVHFLVKP